MKLLKRLQARRQRKQFLANSDINEHDVWFVLNELEVIEAVIGSQNLPSVIAEYQEARASKPDYSRDTIELSWHIDDVKSLDDSLTDEQARQILQMVKHNHDASIGVNWETLEVNIDMFKADQERENSRAKATNEV